MGETRGEKWSIDFTVNCVKEHKSSYGIFLRDNIKPGDKERMKIKDT